MTRQRYPPSLRPLGALQRLLQPDYDNQFCSVCPSQSGRTPRRSLMTLSPPRDFGHSLQTALVVFRPVSAWQVGAPIDPFRHRHLTASGTYPILQDTKKKELDEIRYFLFRLATTLNCPID